MDVRSKKENCPMPITWTLRLTVGIEFTIALQAIQRDSDYRSVDLRLPHVSLHNVNEGVKIEGLPQR